MKTIKGFFTDKDGVVSWRKIMTCGLLICFMTAVLGYLISHNFKDELPGSYQAIIAGGFAFYFAKDLIRNTKVIN